MTHLENTFKDALEESLDKNFPKGKCKERGAALVLFADAVMVCRTALQAYGDAREQEGREKATDYIQGMSAYIPNKEREIYDREKKHKIILKENLYEVWASTFEEARLPDQP